MGSCCFGHDLNKKDNTRRTDKGGTPNRKASAQLMISLMWNLRRQVSASERKTRWRQEDGGAGNGLVNGSGNMKIEIRDGVLFHYITLPAPKQHLGERTVGVFIPNLNINNDIQIEKCCMIPHR